jgi:hypothetical protein
MALDRRGGRRPQITILDPTRRKTMQAGCGGYRRKSLCGNMFRIVQCRTGILVQELNLRPLP